MDTVNLQDSREMERAILTPTHENWDITIMHLRCLPRVFNFSACIYQIVGQF